MVNTKTFFLIIIKLLLIFYTLNNFIIFHTYRIRRFLFADYSIFTWGEDKHGQLGHGEETPWKNDPQCVVLLLDKHITQLNDKKYIFFLNP